MGRPRWRKKTDLERRLRRRSASNDLTRRFPLIVETLARPRSRSCIIDGETVACDDNGVAGKIKGISFAAKLRRGSTHTCSAAWSRCGH